VNSPLAEHSNSRYDADTVAAALSAYAPQDRRRAGATGLPIPDHAPGAVLFVDISGFTPLTERLAHTLGMSRGADALTRLLNAVYTALIREVETRSGSVIGFSGDAITCWFAETPDGANSDPAFHDDLAPTITTRRALGAAVAIQQAMAPFAAIEATPGIPASLAVKCALTSGHVYRARVGDPLIQSLDVIAGPAVDRMASAEQLAKRTEIIADAASTRLLGNMVQVIEWRKADDGLHAHIVPTDQFVEAHTLDTPPLPPLADAESWVHRPLLSAIRSGHERFTAELRPAIALFVHFGGIDWEHDPDAPERLDQWIRWAQSVVQTYGGLIIQLTTGDKGSYFYAAFGAPVMHEDDAGRAARAAIDLTQPPGHLSFIRSIQCGLSRGLMRTGAYGGPSRRTYGVLGAEVNRAARLMTLAHPGQILTGKAFAESLQSDSGIRLTFVGNHALKGTAEPTPVYAIEAQSGHTPQEVRVFAQPTVGRTRELALLTSTWREAEKRHGKIILLEGGPGVGKSHLVAEAAHLARTDGMQVTLASCQSLTQQSPFSALRPILQQLLAVNPADTDALTHLQERLATDNPLWLEHLPLLADPIGLSIPESARTTGLDPKTRRQAITALAIEIVLDRARKTPLLLIIEDAHWLDEASDAILLALSQALVQEPICLLLVHRPRPTGITLLDAAPTGEGPARVEIHLAELDPEGSIALLERRLQGPLAPLTGELLQTLSQGNPFYLEELADMMQDGGRLTQINGTWHLAHETLRALRAANCLTDGDEPRLAPGAPLDEAQLNIPASVQGVVLARLDRLPATARLTLKVASIFGRTFDLSLLEDVAPLAQVAARESVRAAIREALARDFVRTDELTPQANPAQTGERYQFKHNITREVAYATLTQEQRQELHLAVGELLEERRSEAVDELAHHFARCNTSLPHLRSRALTHLEAAAKRAVHDYANETALAWLDRALALDARPDFLRTRIAVLHLLGRREEQHETLQALDTLTSAHPAEPSNSTLWGDYYEAIGDYEAATQALEQALSRFTADPVAMAAIRVRMGMIAWRQGAYTAAAETFDSALSALDSAGSIPSGMQERADAHYGLGLVMRQLSRFDEAAAHFRQDFELNEQLGNRAREARSVFALGVLESLRRNFGKALPWFEQSLAIRKRIGDRAGIGACLLALAQTRGSMGDHGAALPLLEAALRTQQAIQNRWEECLILNELGILHMAVGDYPAAAAALQQGLAGARAIGSDIGIAYLTCNLGQVQRDWGDLQNAETTLREGLALAREQEDTSLEAIYCADLALTLVYANRPAEATDFGNRALELNTMLEQETSLTAVHATLALAAQQSGNMDQSLHHAHRALEILNATDGAGVDYPQRDYWMCAQALEAAGATQEATQSRKAARRHLDEKAARISDNRMQSSFLNDVPVHRAIIAATSSPPVGPPKD